jgi:beta-xylosidase
VRYNLEVPVEAVALWNEPNNRSHWDFSCDPEWRTFGTMVSLAADAVGAERPGLTRVLGGISPIDPDFMRTLRGLGVLAHVDAVAVHGFPMDWNPWYVHEWPDRLAAVRTVTDLPIWVTEVGVSSFGCEEVQEYGLQRTAELLVGRAARVHWYSLLDLPRAWEAESLHPEAEGEAYVRHFSMGLIRADGTPKRALRVMSEWAPQLGVCQWFHYEDARLGDAVRRLRALGVRYVRTGLSWADSLRPGALAWFDRQMAALDEFEVTVTFCFTPKARGIVAHHTSPPKVPGEFADFCAAMVRRYG